eukprot:TRINITY_DN1869_c5_g1_i1.p1 TRINITY_DN1869_c5_g1~~TRINITY_DN1869_c5_g1_i1.p1  ORF type:complete len:521 (-),score=54.62 TRINITY_DN1869_c5_g1_i1:341-1903(-)
MPVPTWKDFSGALNATEKEALDEAGISQASHLAFLTSEDLTALKGRLRPVPRRMLEHLATEYGSSPGLKPGLQAGVSGRSPLLFKPVGSPVGSPYSPYNPYAEPDDALTQTMVPNAKDTPVSTQNSPVGPWRSVNESPDTGRDGPLSTKQKDVPEPPRTVKPTDSPVPPARVTVVRPPSPQRRRSSLDRGSPPVAHSTGESAHSPPDPDVPPPPPPSVGISAVAAKPAPAPAVAPAAPPVKLPSEQAMAQVRQALPPQRIASWVHPHPVHSVLVVDALAAEGAFPESLTSAHRATVLNAVRAAAVAGARACAGTGGDADSEGGAVRHMQSCKAPQDGGGGLVADGRGGGLGPVVSCHQCSVQVGVTECDGTPAWVWRCVYCPPTQPFSLCRSCGPNVGRPLPPDQLSSSHAPVGPGALPEKDPFTGQPTGPPPTTMVSGLATAARMYGGMSGWGGTQAPAGALQQQQQQRQQQAYAQGLYGQPQQQTQQQQRFAGGRGYPTGPGMGAYGAGRGVAFGGMF